LAVKPIWLRNNDGSITGSAVIAEAARAAGGVTALDPTLKRHPDIAESHPPPRRVGCGRTMDDEHRPTTSTFATVTASRRHRRVLIVATS
jgi:hypothetical protein